MKGGGLLFSLITHLIPKSKTDESSTICTQNPANVFNRILIIMKSAYAIRVCPSVVHATHLFKLIFWYQMQCASKLFTQKNVIIDSPKKECITHA